MSLWEPAYKLRISEVIEGSIERSDEQGKFILITKSGIRASRVRVMGTIVDVFRSELSDYMNFTLDDGTGTIRVKVWGGKTSTSDIKIGGVVDVVGLIRSYRDEVYLVPELVIRVEDPNWELVRELELYLFSSLSIGERVTRKVSLQRSILKLIDSLDMGDGVTKETLEKFLNVPDDELERELDMLLRDGIIYETSNGSYKRLGSLDDENSEG
ncbi:MAG: OB-fold nucleic acid binding domain-containing protein [Candidatus Jordarchaeales archaeon]